MIRVSLLLAWKRLADYTHALQPAQSTEGKSSLQRVHKNPQRKISRHHSACFATHCMYTYSTSLLEDSLKLVTGLPEEGKASNRTGEPRNGTREASGV